MDQLTLRPDDEFEAALIGMVETYRTKTAEYADPLDPESAFIDIAVDLSTTPLAVAEILGAKHQRSIRTFLRTGKQTAGSDDAFGDRAVYAVHSLVLYRRRCNGDQRPDMSQPLFSDADVPVL